MQLEIVENPIQFFTATIFYWQPILRSDQYKQLIIDSLTFLVKAGRIKVYAFVLMPNHIHLLWKISNGHQRHAVQRDFLRFTAQKIKQDLQINHPVKLRNFLIKTSDRKYQIWERNALSIDIYSKEVLEQKLEYIHNNPLQPQWLLVPDGQTYHYSSAQFYMDSNTNWTFLTHYMEACQ